MGDSFFSGASGKKQKEPEALDLPKDVDRPHE